MSDDLDPHEDMISAVRASVERLQNPPEKVEQEPEAAAAPEPEEKESAAPQRARDPETGQFVPKAGTEKPAKTTTETTEAVEAQPEAPSTAPLVKPPTSWSTEAKAEFAKLSPAVQQAVLKREDEMSRGAQQYSSERQRLQSLESVIAPRRAIFQKYGLKNDAEAVDRLLSLSEQMEHDPVGTWFRVAQQYGVDPSRYAGAAQQMPQQQPQQFQQPPPQQFYQPPPNLQHLVKDILDTENAKMMVAEFEANPPEHYQDVKPLMKTLLEAGQASDLKDAYEKAIWSVPSIRLSLLESQRTAEEQKRQEAAKAKAAKKVTAANASLNGAPHGTPETKPATTRGSGQFGEVADDVMAAVAALR